MPLTVVSYVPALFAFTASVAVDATSYDPSALLPQAWQTVSSAFAFASVPRAEVAASEIIGLVQGVPGVLAVGTEAAH